MQRPEGHSFLTSVLVLLYFTLIDDSFYFRTKSTPLTVIRANENPSLLFDVVVYGVFPFYFKIYNYKNNVKLKCKFYNHLLIIVETRCRQRVVFDFESYLTI